jgi:hypothetical protein
MIPCRRRISWEKEEEKLSKKPKKMMKKGNLMKMQRIPKKTGK